MKVTGIVRKVDKLGRIVLPMEIRNVLGIEVGTEMEIYISGENIILTKYIPRENIVVMLNVFEENIEHLCMDLELEEVETVRRHIQDIRTMLEKRQ